MNGELAILRRGVLVAAFGVALWLGLSAAPLRLSAAPAEDAIYAFTDDRGRLVHVQRLSDVPEALRASAQRVDTPDAAPAANGGVNGLLDWLGEQSGVVARKEPILYRYSERSGRTVFTNLASTVPADQRELSRVDLRHVPLNSLLASDLDRELSRRYQDLRKSGTCERLRTATEAPWWQRVWEERRPLVLCAGVLLLLLLLTPWMASKGWGAPWARVLYTAVPLLGFVGTTATLLHQSSASLSRMESSLKQCEPDAWQNAGGLPQRFQLVQSLEAEKNALAQIERESR
jgi:hypothetical protein